MDTLIKSQPETFSLKMEKRKTSLSVSEFLNDLEANRFGIAPMLLVFMACLGGIAAAFAVQESEIELLAVAVSTTLIEVLIIALAPMRIIVLASVVAFIIDLFVLIF